jgi:hypothetical protein
VTNNDQLIASLIAGDAPPRGLAVAVAKAIATLAWTIQKEGEYPHRSVLRARLQKLHAAIETVRGEIRDLDMSRLLRGKDDFFLNQNETYHGLGDLAERVKRSLSHLPKRKGRDKFFGGLGGASAQENCALMISILWEQIHFAPPANTKAEAQEACAALWKAAGGTVKGRRRKTGQKLRLPSARGSTEVWRDHLRAAKRLAASEEAKFLRRSLDQNWDPALKRATPREVGTLRRLYE